jgi:LmbE family N-acetylglucosaminyl deacetylase
MLESHERFRRRKARPLLVELHRALGRLGSVLTVMNTGAHPDDEQSGLLAMLRFGLGMHVVIACSTRGEGGQNGIGPERGALLGRVRSRELEEAARELDADVAWLGFGPDDPVHDFGFSRSGEDTLRRWGRERIIERLVRAYRRERPDIVIPTFLDVPGQHGHHRAMTEAAETAIALAADPTAFPAHFAEGLAPWRVSKFYLPAWSGAGSTYDDEVPPPNASLVVEAPGPDPVTGAAYDEIGEWSRAFHASQGMGRWSPTPRETWPLHLRIGGPGSSEDDIRSGLPATLGQLGRLLGGDAGSALAEVEAEIGRAVAAFPRRDEIVAALSAASGRLSAAAAALNRDEAALHGHRLARKEQELDAALLLAAGVSATAWAEPADVPPGGNATLIAHVAAPEDIRLDFELRLPDYIIASGPVMADGLTRFSLAVAAGAPLSPAFTAHLAGADGPGEVGLVIVARIAERRARCRVALEEPVTIVPRRSVSAVPPALIAPLSQLPRTAAIDVHVEGPPGALELIVPDGLRVTPAAAGLELSCNRSLSAGRYTLPFRVDGDSAHRVVTIAHPHIGRVHHAEPAAVELLALDLSLPSAARIGYAGGGSDRAGDWLRRMGGAVTDLDAAALAGDLSPFTTIVVGILAFGLRPDLAAATAKLRAWVEAGGHLLTLYHRPGDGWAPEATPPRRIVIGSPSLRWRVTDPAAAVEVLLPSHLLLAGPNVIGAADWAGWDKERGLYFAADWDPAYEALLAMGDDGEPRLRGALLSGRIGRGRHTHVSLVLHHQLDKLVPGAFRLMANLVQPA